MSRFLLIVLAITRLFVHGNSSHGNNLANHGPKLRHTMHDNRDPLTLFSHRRTTTIKKVGATNKIQLLNRHLTNEFSPEDDYEETEEDYEDEEHEEHGNSEKQNSVPVALEEHPLRTDEWLVRVNLQGLGPWSVAREAQLFPITKQGTSNDQYCVRRWGRRRKREQVMKFSRNGYVLLLEDDMMEQQTPSPPTTVEHANETLLEPIPSSTVQQQQSVRRTAVGKWRVSSSGVSWDIPVRVPIKNKSNQKLSTKMTLPMSMDDAKPIMMKRTVLHYHADLHLNKFNARPRMFRGIVTRDRFLGASFLPPHLFRPIVATFTAVGIGQDTADVTYRDRGFGLSPPEQLQQQQQQQQQR